MAEAVPFHAGGWVGADPLPAPVPDEVRDGAPAEPSAAPAAPRTVPDPCGTQLWRGTPSGTAGHVQLRTERWRQVRSPAAWLPRLRVLIAAVDGVVLVAAVGLGLLARFGLDLPVLSGQSQRMDSGYLGAAVVIAATWFLALTILPTRDARVIGNGLEEYKQVVMASVRVFSIVAIVAYLAKIDLARLFVAFALPLGVVLLLGERWLLRRWLHRQRAQGRFSHRVLLVGGQAHVADLAARLARAPESGLVVVAACLPGGSATGPGEAGADGLVVPVVGSPDTLLDALAATGADTVAVVPSPDLGPDELRRLSWSLEGTGVDLIVSPVLTDVAGPRVHVRPVAGLPLLHVEAPRYEGMSWLVKSVFDQVAAAVGLLVLSPLLAVVAVLVSTTSRGPVFYRQERVGLGGTTFRLYKFRTMVDGADAMVDELAERNESDGPLFKIRDDPRVTGVGRWLRRASLDELPQLLNVAAGQMSLVGPRPPLPDEVDRYADRVRRRLLVKPGITGLWQVSGRSDLSWEDSVRLDLYYVENWTLTGDFIILLRTLAAVVRGEGAY